MHRATCAGLTTKRVLSALEVLDKQNFEKGDPLDQMYSKIFGPIAAVTAAAAAGNAGTASAASAAAAAAAAAASAATASTATACGSASNSGDSGDKDKFYDNQVCMYVCVSSGS